MVYAYAYKPAYYSPLHHSIASLCKTILPFYSKKRRLPAAERKLSEQQLENLKWQQDSFHQILNLMGLCREGIVPNTEVTAFRTRILNVLVASSQDPESPEILRDKLLFLQELSYAECISADEHNSSKRLLHQRLAAQGFEMDSRNAMISAPKVEEEWSIIDLKDEQTPFTSDDQNSQPRKHKGAAASVFSLLSSSSQKQGKNRDPKIETADQMVQNLRESEKETEAEEGRVRKSAKKQWGVFGGFEKWKKRNPEDETTPLQLRLSSDTNGGFDGAKQINKRKLHLADSSSGLLVDTKVQNSCQVPENKIKVELSRIQSELSSTNQSPHQFSNHQIAAISTNLPVDKADLKNFFPKSWCDRHGDKVLDVVKKEFKDHTGDMETKRSAAAAGVKNDNVVTGWAVFDDENSDPNLFGHQEHQLFPVEQVVNFADSNHMNNWKSGSGRSIPFDTNTNPFCWDYAKGGEEEKLVSESVGFVNPFGVPSSSRLGH